MQESGDIEVPLVEQWDIGGDLASPVLAQGLASALQTAFVILSIYMGLGMLSQPYALRVGGWASLTFLISAGALFLGSAVMVSRACELLPPGHEQNYSGLGHAVWGSRGRILVSIIAGMELLGGAIIATAVMFEQFEILLPEKGILGLSPFSAAIVLTSCCLYPALILPDVAHVAPLSAAGSVAASSVAVAVISLLFIDFQRAKIPRQPPAQHALARWPGMLQSLGIFAVSMSGHSTLPALRVGMQQPTKFLKAFIGAFITMIAIYASVAASGYYYWGEDSTPVVTYDLAKNSPFSRHSGKRHPSWLDWIAIDDFLAFMVLITCSAKVPALTMVLSDLISGLLHTSDSSATVADADDLQVVAQAQRLQGWKEFRRRRQQLTYRVLLCTVSLGVAILAKDNLGELLSLVGGGCSMATSLILPTAFYSKLSWHDHSFHGKLILRTLLIFGLILLLLVGGIDLNSLWHKMQ